MGRGYVTPLYSGAEKTGGAGGASDTPSRALTAQELAIAVRLRVVLRDRDWHTLPELLAAVSAFPRTAVFTTLRTLLAQGQLDQETGQGLGRYRFAPRPGRHPYHSRHARER